MMTALIEREHDGRSRARCPKCGATGQPCEDFEAVLRHLQERARDEANSRWPLLRLASSACGCRRYQRAGGFGGDAQRLGELAGRQGYGDRREPWSPSTTSPWPQPGRRTTCSP